MKYLLLFGYFIILLFPLLQFYFVFCWSLDKVSSALKNLPAILSLPLIRGGLPVKSVWALSEISVPWLSLCLLSENLLAASASSLSLRARCWLLVPIIDAGPAGAAADLSPSSCHSHLSGLVRSDWTLRVTAASGLFCGLGLWLRSTWYPGTISYYLA